MGLMDKLKNLFTEEVEEEVEVKDEPIKKEMIQVEIPSPTTPEVLPWRNFPSNCSPVP